jgi:hypothetical protein
MAKLLTNPHVQLTKLDRMAFDPDKGAFNDLAWWAKLYFDGTVFPWQSYFYHYPCNDKMVIAGIRTGKTQLAGFGFAHKGMYHSAIKMFNVSIQWRIAAGKVTLKCLHDIGRDRIFDAYR